MKIFNKDPQPPTNPQEPVLPIFEPQTPEGIKLKNNLDAARKAYADRYNQFLEDRKKESFFIKNTWRSVFGSKVEDSEIPDDFKDLEYSYDSAAAEFGNHMFSKREEELKKDKSLTPDNITEQLKEYKQNEIFTRVIVQEQMMLNGLKAENLPPKEKALWKKAIDGYIKLPGWSKLLISSAVGTAVIAGASGATIAAAGGVAYYAGLRLTRGAVGMVAGQATNKVFDLLIKDKSGVKRENEKIELAEIFKEGDFSDKDTFIKSKKGYAEALEKEKKAKRNRLITKAVIGFAVGMGTSMALSSYAHGHMSTGAQETQTSAGPARPGTGGKAPGSTDAKSGGTSAESGASGKNGIMTPEEAEKKIKGMGIKEAKAQEAFNKGAGIGKESPLKNIRIETTGMGHEVTSEFSVKLGEGDVPKNLETVYNAISADHMRVPASGMIDEQFAAKSLNMSANLMRLTEGHNVAGISADDFAKVAGFKNGILEIKNPSGFNQIVSKLQTHSEELWGKGVLQSKGAAITQIPKISKGGWLRIVHADGMHEGTPVGGGSQIKTGLLGHQEVDDKHIGNFSKSEIVRKAVEEGKKEAMIKTKARLAADFDKPEKSEPEPSVSNQQEKPSEISDSSEEAEIARKMAESEAQKSSLLKTLGFNGDPKDENAVEKFFYELNHKKTGTAPSVEDINSTEQPAKSSRSLFGPKKWEAPSIEEQRNFAQSHTDFIGKNDFNLTTAKLMQAYENHQKDLEFIFKDLKESPKNIWSSVKDLKAIEVIDQDDSIKPEIRSLAIYLAEIRKFTGLKTEDSFLFFDRPRPVSEYAALGLQKIAQEGQLENFEESLRQAKG